METQCRWCSPEVIDRHTYCNDRCRDYYYRARQYYGRRKQNSDNLTKQERDTWFFYLRANWISGDLPMSPLIRMSRNYRQAGLSWAEIKERLDQKGYKKVSEEDIFEMCNSST